MQSCFGNEVSPSTYIKIRNSILFDLPLRNAMHDGTIFGWQGRMHILTRAARLRRALLVGGHSHAYGRGNPNYVYIIHNMEINNPGGGNPCMYIANNMLSEPFNVAHSFVGDEHVETLQRFLDSAQVRTILPSFTFCIRKTEMKFEMWEFVKSAYEHLPCNPTRANRVC